MGWRLIKINVIPYLAKSAVGPTGEINPIIVMFKFYVIM